MTGPTEEVARTGSASEAQIIAGFLESNGIAAVVSSDDAGGLEPQWQLTQGVRVLVLPEDLGEAHRLLAEADSGADSVAGSEADPEVDPEADPAAD